MNVIGYIILIAFLPVALMLFVVLPVRRAIIWTFLTGWLFLPLGYIKIATGIPTYTKVSATAIAALLGCAIFDSGRMLRLKPSWLDVPIAVYLVWPVVTNSLNGVGVYEGFCTALELFFRWGAPWIIGRAYFADLAGARELAQGVVVGGLIYVPMCLIEIVMSPQLNMWVYGFYQHAFIQTRRMGGWRPMVFMQHGLAVGLWMAVAALGAVWLWKSRALPTLMGLPAALSVPVLMWTAVLCKSLYAMFLMGLGLGLLWMARMVGVRWVLVALALAAPGYMVFRGLGDVALQPVVKVVDAVAGFDRASSLSTRLKNETLIVERGLQRPVTGWGGNGAYLVRDPGNPDRFLSVPDQFWVITLGQGGVVGLGALCGVLLLPAGLFFRACPARDLDLPAIAPVAVLAMVPVLFMLDCLMNAMMNPIFVMASACVASVVVAARAAEREARSVPRMTTAWGSGNVGVA